MKTKWFKGLNIITGVLIATAISGGIHFLTFNLSFMGKLGSTYGNAGMVIEILFIAPGILIGIFWKIFLKIYEIEPQYELIKIKLKLEQFFSSDNLLLLLKAKLL